MEDLSIFSSPREVIEADYKFVDGDMNRYGTQNETQEQRAARINRVIYGVAALGVLAKGLSPQELEEAFASIEIEPAVADAVEAVAAVIKISRIS